MSVHSIVCTAPNAHIALLTSPDDVLLTSDPGDLSNLTASLGMTPRVVRV